jgi:hypothetical protein
MTMTARTDKCDDNVLAHFHRGDTIAYFFDYSGAFVTVNGRKRATPSTIGV